MKASRGNLPRPSRTRRLLGGLAVAVTSLLIVTASGAGAQALQPRLPPATATAACPDATAPANATADAGRVDQMLRQGQQAALAGDRTSAREFLAEAARLDPSRADAAYHHGRLLEELGEHEEARIEYCRFLSLPVSAADSAEVSERIAALAINGAEPPSFAVQALTDGTEFLRANDPRSAERAFSYVISNHPEIAESYLNRAIARESMGRDGDAIRDYRAYLRVRPDGEDRDAIEARIFALATALPSPATVMTRGLLLPGLGQLTTDRPVLGAVALAATVGAGMLAAQSRVVTRTGVFEHPFEEEEHYTYEYQTRTRPYLAAGIAGGAAITLAAAIEAYLHARAVQSAARGDSRRIGILGAAAPQVEASADGSTIGLGVRFLLGH